MNEQDQFLNDLEKEEGQDPFAEFETVEPEKETDPEDPEAQPESVKDRRHRRLEAKLQAEREANIQLATRLETLAEAKRDTESPDYLKNVERIYGTDSPEATAATELLKNAFLSVKEEAKREAREEIEEQRRAEQQEVQKEEAQLDSMIEEIEDEYGIDLTSSASTATRQGFFKMLEKMSPKDSDGNVLAYADHHAVWEDYQARINKKPENRAKDLAARSMTQSGASTESKLQDDATVRFLRENGII